MHTEYRELELRDPRVVAAIQETLSGEQEVLHKELQQLELLRGRRSGVGKFLNLFDSEIMNLVRHTALLEHRIRVLENQLSQYGSI